MCLIQAARFQRRRKEEASFVRCAWKVLIEMRSDISRSYVYPLCCWTQEIAPFYSTPPYLMSRGRICIYLQIFRCVPQITKISNFFFTYWHMYIVLGFQTCKYFHCYFKNTKFCQIFLKRTYILKIFQRYETNFILKEI